MHATCNPLRWLARGTALAAFMLDLRVSAQDTNATCTLASLQWSFNSQKQSPCVIASTLLGVCSGGDYNVVALPDATSDYLGPTIDGANPCQCNTVVYSLMSACALCQNATITTWSEWATNCATVYTTYPQPIPGKLHVPAYAYLDVESQGIFNADSAKQDANATESTALPSSSTTRSQTSSKTSSTPAAATSTATAGSITTSNESHRNAIGGGVVGSILGLGVLLLLIGSILAYRRRRQERSLRRLRSEEEAVGSQPAQNNSVLSTNSADPVNMSEVQPGVSHIINSDSQNVPSISVSSSSDLGDTTH
ncbi:hypothetical protein GYMLUDRAFT_45822 [Collybiopsis luxurians FD-317 M1]|uniref:Mid2 domain-containing protein n=1 Tax=Collybiopsis luxurians FD-317 M1 TaxID=944289 RepID=A0A0D0C598_9AGAR|nr:hypothetical protein GYMLUDRAFT_45822 [Collybiopsis luxurians FD-317 M1]